MSYKIYARKVLEDEKKLSPELLDIHVTFTKVVGASNPTQVKFSLGDHEAEKDSPDWLASVYVRHPFNVTLTEDNWAEYLYLHLTTGSLTFIDKKIENTHPQSIERQGFKSLNTYAFIGEFVFKLESLKGEYFITTKGPDLKYAPSRICPNVLVIYDTNDAMQNRLVRYNYLGLQVRSSKDEKPLYYIDFETPLGPKSLTYIHYVGMNKVLFGGTEEGVKDFAPAPDWGLLQAAYQDPELNLLPNDRLIHFTFGKFEYFSSLDAKLIFTLHARPMDIAFQAFKAYLDDPAHMPSATLENLKHEYNRLTSRYATDGGTEATRQEVLNDCIFIFQKIQQSK